MRRRRWFLVAGGVFFLAGLGYLAYVIIKFTGEPQALPPARAVSEPSQPKIIADCSCNGNVQESRLIHKIPPRYSKQARQMRSGFPFVLVAVTVSEDGRVEKADIIRGHSFCDDAVRKALAHWRYTPTLCNGTPCRVILRVRLPCGRKA
jgi:TonB family protein